MDGGNKLETVTDFIFFGSKLTVDGYCSHEIKRHLFLGRKAMTNLNSILKIRDKFANKGPHSQNYGFTSSHVQIQELDHKECQESKNWCFQILVLEETVDSPLDYKEIKTINLK